MNVRKHPMSLSGKAQWNPNNKYIHKAEQLSSTVIQRTCDCISLCLIFPIDARANDIYLTLLSEMSSQYLRILNNAVDQIVLNYAKADLF